MTIAFEELEGSPTIHVGPEGTVARRIFRVAWGDWPALAQELLGTYRRVGDQFQFTPPLEFPDLAGVVVTALDVAPMDPENPNGAAVVSLRDGTNAYPAAGARVTAAYESLPDASEPSRGDLPPVPFGTYLTFRADLGSEFDHHAVARLALGRAGRSAAAAGRSSGCRHTHGRVPPHLAPRRFAQLVGDASTAGQGERRGVRCAAAGTVVFMGARVVREFEFGRGSGFWRVEYLFAERAIELAGGGLAGWNHMYKQEAVGGEHWIRVLNADGEELYATADLLPLFTFGP